MTGGAISEVDKSKRISRWYFGGIASAMAACCTHPLDLLKVTYYFSESAVRRLQAQAPRKPMSFL